MKFSFEITDEQLRIDCDARGMLLLMAVLPTLAKSEHLETFQQVAVAQLVKEALVKEAAQAAKAAGVGD